MKILALALAALCGVAAPAWAQPAPSSNNPEARRHFQEGVRSAQRGDLSKALNEFEAAYAAQPNFMVLYNIGQAHSSLGHAVDAVTAFERYLAEGDEQVSAPRREEVEAAIAANRQRIGLLQIVPDATGRARVWVDGSEILPERLAAPLPLTEGPHSILYIEDGCRPVSRAERVLAGERLEVKLSRVGDCQKPLGQLAIDCDVPDVEVEVVGVTQVRTPLDAPLLVPVGDLAIRFRRPGYVEISRQVLVDQRTPTRVACQQRALQPLPVDVAARLIVQKSPADAQVLVDGLPFAGGALPAGPHHVVIACEGFVPSRRFISLEANKAATFSATLAKTPERRARDQASAAHRQHWGLALGGAGVAFLGTAGGLYAWNSQRYTDWRDSRTLNNGQADLNFATSVQRIDDVSMAFALLGAGLTGAGAWLYFHD